MVAIKVRHRQGKSHLKPGKGMRRAVLLHTQRPPDCCKTYDASGPGSDCWDCQSNAFTETRFGLALLGGYSTGGDVLDLLIAAEETLSKRSAMTRLGMLAYRNRL